MRLYILRALVRKEIHRHLSNRGGLALAFLLIAAAVLLSVFNPAAVQGGNGGSDAGMVGGVHSCILEYHGDSALIEALKKSVPNGLKVIFVDRKSAKPNELIAYSPGVGGIHLQSITQAEGRSRLAVQIWHPKGDIAAMAPYEQWLCRELRRHYQNQAEQLFKDSGRDPRDLGTPEFAGDDLWAVRESFKNLDQKLAPIGMAASMPMVPEVSFERQGLAGKVLDLRSAIATGMVVFALYFTCVYLLPTLNCEERERGVLLAQALSPASPLEILAAKFLFYPVLGIGLAAILAGIYKPSVLGGLFFWLSLIAVASGFLGIGMTIATLARTQRAAFLGAMCYLLSVSLILFICSTNGIPYVNYLALEYHGPRILHAALSGEFQPHHWLNLAGAMLLATAWMSGAAYLFRKRGWQ